MTIKEAQNLAHKNYTSINKLEIEVLLMNILSLSRESLYLEPLKKLNHQEEEAFKKGLSLLKNGYPLNYIIRKKEFYGLDFIVDENTLIPRPETEGLIDILLDDYNKNHYGNYVKILDTGTGSGVIAVVLAKKIEKSFVFALDISKEAISLAQENAKTHSVLNKTKFFKGNIFTNWDLFGIDKNFDYIISNPPYISEEKYYKLSNTLKHEPIYALHGGRDGTLFYRKIIKEAYKFLKVSGKILLEIDHEIKEKVYNILKNNRFSDINIMKDYSGFFRFVKGEKK